MRWDASLSSAFAIFGGGGTHGESLAGSHLLEWSLAARLMRPIRMAVIVVVEMIPAGAISCNIIGLPNARWVTFPALRPEGRCAKEAVRCLG
jgi:hypothetical protein